MSGSVKEHTLKLTPTQAWAIYTFARHLVRTEFPEYQDLLQPVFDQIKADADQILCTRCKERPRTTRTLVCRRCYYRHQKRLKRNDRRMDEVSNHR